MDYMRFFLHLSLMLLTASISSADQKHSGSRDGRFQVVQISEYRRDQFLIDTHTGTLWKSICGQKEGDDCTYSYWSKEDIEGITATRQEIRSILKALSTSSRKSESGQECCKVCKGSKACGDKCIEWEQHCDQPPGCACDSR